MKTANYNFDIDLSKIILWQYDDAENVKKIVDNEQKFMDSEVRDFWLDFNKNIFNLSTCNTFGLALWGKLLNVARPTYTVDDVEYEYTDAQYRLLLQSRIYLLTFDGSAYALNKFFKILLPEYPVVVTDFYDMSAKVDFLVEPPAEILQVFRNPDFLPRPSGVQYIIGDLIQYSTTFGFEGQTTEGVEPPSFTEAVAPNYDPETDAGGTFVQ